jgi:hypothetical protein
LGFGLSLWKYFLFDHIESENVCRKNSFSSYDTIHLIYNCLVDHFYYFQFIFTAYTKTSYLFEILWVSSRDFYIFGDLKKVKEPSLNLRKKWERRKHFSSFFETSFKISFLHLPTKKPSTLFHFCLWNFLETFHLMWWKKKRIHKREIVSDINYRRTFSLSLD